MKSFYRQLLIGSVTCICLIACDDDDTDFAGAASLKVVHAIPGAPEIQINYLDENIPFATNKAFGFGETKRYTLVTGETAVLRFNFVTDTTRQVFHQDVNLKAGEIATLYLKGDSTNLSSIFSIDSFANYPDSVFGVNFVHGADGLGPVSIRSISLDNSGMSDTTTLVSMPASGSVSDFFQLKATKRIDRYAFQYLDGSDSVLASLEVEPLKDRSSKVFKNITLPLIGSPGEGASIIEIDNF